MKIELLPNWNILTSTPAFYDAESVTALESIAKLHSKVNEVISAFNTLSENVEKEIADFKEDTNQDLKVFETAMRQEFQDFIDIVDMKLANSPDAVANAVIEALESEY